MTQHTREAAKGGQSKLKAREGSEAGIQDEASKCGFLLQEKK